MIFVVSLIFLFSCSHSEKKYDLEANLQSSLKLIEQKEVEYSFTNKKSLIFKDVTKDYGLDGVVANNFNIIDLNSDGFSDIVLVPEYYAQPVFYLFNPKLNKFIKMNSLFPNTVKATYLVFNDLNRDGVIDVIAGVLNQKTELEKNPLRIFYGREVSGKLRFEKGTSLLKDNMPSSGVNLFDYDLDGDLDIFISNWFGLYKGLPIPVKDVLLENKKSRFEDVTWKLSGELNLNQSKKMYVNARPTTGAQVCDINQDGFPDILTASASGYPNALWLNLFKFRKDYRYFVDYGIQSRFSSDTVGRLTQTGGGRTFSVACSDYNDDGIMDVFVGELSHSYDSETKDKSSVLTGSTKGRYPLFIRTEYVLDANDIHWTQADKRASWIDFNNDGREDLLVDNSGYPPHTRLLLFKQYPDHSFENISKRAGIDIVNPHASVLLDFNKDGKIDILTARSSLRDSKIKRRVFLFKNISKNKNRFIKIKLKGNRSNSEALGATIILKIKSEEKVIYKTKYVNFFYGHNSLQNENFTHFGIEEGDELKSIKVRWPYSEDLNSQASHMEQTYNVDLSKGQEIVIEEDKGVISQI